MLGIREVTTPPGTDVTLPDTSRIMEAVKAVFPQADVTTYLPLVSEYALILELVLLPWRELVEHLPELDWFIQRISDAPTLHYLVMLFQSLCVQLHMEQVRATQVM
jgi:hypothetical protein